MERYNLILDSGDSPGLRVLGTSQYLELLQRDPGRKHENFGDLYSHVGSADLAEVIRGSMTRVFDGFSQYIQIVESIPSASDRVDSRNLYLGDEEGGVRVYCPGVDNGDSLSAGDFYPMLCLAFIQDLIANRDGSLIKDLDKLGEVCFNEICNLFREL